MPTSVVGPLVPNATAPHRHVSRVMTLPPGLAPPRYQGLFPTDQAGSVATTRQPMRAGLRRMRSRIRPNVEMAAAWASPIGQPRPFGLSSLQRRWLKAT